MRRLSTTAAAAALAAVVLALVGCDAPTDTTPAACLAGAVAYERSLATVPAETTIDGVPISDCLAENQKAGDLARVGESMVLAATRLNLESRADPGGPAPLRLGYLVGAAEHGAAETGGIHADLIRRLSSAARFSPAGATASPAFRRAYRRGLAAGNARG